MATGLALLEEAVELFAGVDLETCRATSCTTRSAGSTACRTAWRRRSCGSCIGGTRRWRGPTTAPRHPAPAWPVRPVCRSPTRKRLVRRGRALQSMPLTEAAYAAGEINGAHVDLVASCDRAWVNADFAESEAKLVGLLLARTCSPRRPKRSGCGSSTPNATSTTPTLTRPARDADKNTPVGIDVVPRPRVHRRQPRRAVR